MRKRFVALAMFLASASLAQADMPPPQPCTTGTASWNCSPPAQACVQNGDQVICGEYVGSEPAPDPLHCAAGGDGCYLDANPGRISPSQMTMPGKYDRRNKASPAYVIREKV